MDPNENDGARPGPRYIPRELREPFLEALISAFPLGVVLFDPEGHFIFVNEKTAELNGVSIEDHIGRHIRDVVPALWDDARPILERVREGETVEWEITGDTPGGEGLTCAEQWFPLRDASGDVVAIAGTIVDITDQRHAEATLRESAELRNRVMHLVSHELRGPLTSILGFAQRLERQEHPDQSVREPLALIRQQALEMRDQLDLFLGLSDLDQPAGVLPQLEVAAFDLHALVDDACRRIEGRYEGVRFAREVAGEAEFTTEARSLRPIVTNLLENAAKYGGDDEPVVVRTVCSEGRAVIEVQDRGRGIDETQQARIFEPGFRAAEVRDRGIEGEGLGLFVAERLAMRLGGSLSVRSVVEEGATFRLELPAQDTLAPPR